MKIIFVNDGCKQLKWLEKRFDMNDLNRMFNKRNIYVYFIFESEVLSNAEKMAGLCFETSFLLPTIIFIQNLIAWNQSRNHFL